MKQKDISEFRWLKKSSGPEQCLHVMWGSVLYLLSSVLLHAAIDVTEPSSRQHVWRLLIDESVKMSLNLENVEEEQIRIYSKPAIWITGTCS